MTEDFAGLVYIPRRMEELGYGKHYHIRPRHLVLQPGEKLELEAFNQLYIIVEEPENVSVTSEFGIYDLSSDKVNELTYEHQGSIQINNYSKSINHLRLIQVIPKNKNCKCSLCHHKEKNPCQ